jgi:hypothetical protein
MLKKLALFVAIPVAIAAAPWALFSASGWWSKVTAAISSNSSATTPDGSMPAPVKAASTEDGKSAPAPPDTSSPDSIPVQGLAEVLRFDVTTGWVMMRWPRVSTGLAQLQLQGYRVPLVTGTAEDDLAGALTFYFNPRQEVQRITFQGTTGNPRKLVQLLTGRYSFARRLTNDPSSFVYEVPGPDKKAKSMLWVRPAPVVKSDDTYRRFQVALILERPEKS